MKILNGDVSLKDIQVVFEEPELVIKGNLTLRNVTIEKAPQKLYVEGDVSVWDSRIHVMMELLECKGNLFISQEKEKDFILPDEIIGEKSVALWLNKEIEDNITIRSDGELIVHGKAITKLPKKIVVKGLNISRTSIAEFPEGINLPVEKDKFEAWAESLGYGEYLGGICIDDTPIKSIPEGLSLMGNLSIRRSLVRKLPENMKIGGILDISNTDIEVIPPGVSFSSLIMDSTKIKELPDGFQVKGCLSVDDSLNKFPTGLHVGGTLYCSNKAEITLPSKMRVGALYLYKSGIRSIPADIIVGDEPEYVWYSSIDEERFPRGTIYTFMQDISFEMDSLEIPGDLYLLDTTVLNLPKIIITGGDCYLPLDMEELIDNPNDFPRVLHIGGTLSLPAELWQSDIIKCGKDVTSKSNDNT